MDQPVAERELAPFKINLMLHVIGKRSDGYHLLETLFAFADSGDELVWQPGGPLRLTVTGPFAGMAPAGPDNLVLKAAAALQAAFPKKAALGGSLLLDKRVPAGAGLGGGSADAAAALRLLNRVWNLNLDLATLSRFAAPLGADVPVCVFSQPTWAEGIGDQLSFLPTGKQLPFLVIYPGQPLSTSRVFHSGKILYLNRKNLILPPMPALGDKAFWSNDLEAAAASLEPSIADVLGDLKRIQSQDDRILLSGMSGSGCACFALGHTDSALQHLAVWFRTRYRAAWVFEGKLFSPFI